MSWEGRVEKGMRTGLMDRIPEIRIKTVLTGGY